MPPGDRVLVAMSGGVDSSVAACLLHEQGYDVVGVFMRLGGAVTTPAVETHSLPVLAAAGDAGPGKAPASHPIRERHRGCCSAIDAADARDVAGRLNIPFYVLNFERDFDRLIDYFADEYAAARTPNPCVMCNQWLKFGRLAEYADVIGARWIATGHYARVESIDGRAALRRARDQTKDQSYVLFGIQSGALNRTLLPLGNLTKDEVRAHARRFGLPLHDKPDSQDICFVPDGDYARLVRSRRPDAFRPGDVRHVDGRTLGRHDGLPNFTIGQRRGLGIAAGEPIYVSRLAADTSTVLVGPREALTSRRASVERVNWLVAPPTSPISADVKIRYQHAPAPATVSPDGQDRVSVAFAERQQAITPGQALVMYQGDRVVGGGWISADPAM